MCKPWGWGESISGQKSDKKGWVVKVVGSLTPRVTPINLQSELLKTDLSLSCVN